MKDRSENIALSRPIAVTPLSSPAMVTLHRAAEKLAPLDCSILITGEPGAGKGAIAELIHALSVRREQPLCHIDCSQFSTAAANGTAHQLLAGSATACFRDLLQLSHGAQEVILKLLQRGRSPRLVFISCDNVEQAVRAGRLREDFYAAVGCVTLRVPPLRAHREDIPQLLKYFLGQYAAVFQRPKPQASEEAMEFFDGYRWPGNLVEFETAMKFFAAAGDERLVVSALRASAWVEPCAGTSRSSSLKETSRAASLQAERELISEVLMATGWNRKRAAQRLKISYKALLYKLKQSGIESPAVTSPVVGDAPKVAMLAPVDNGE